MVPLTVPVLISANAAAKDAQGVHAEPPPEEATAMFCAYDRVPTSANAAPRRPALHHRENRVARVEVFRQFMSWGFGLGFRSWLAASVVPHGQGRGGLLVWHACFRVAMLNGVRRNGDSGEGGGFG